MSGTDRKVPISMCHDAINRWRQWAILWATVSVIQWLVIIGIVGGWL